MSSFSNTAIKFHKTVTEGKDSAAHTDYVFIVQYASDDKDVHFEWEVSPYSAVGFQARDFDPRNAPPGTHSLQRDESTCDRYGPEGSAAATTATETFLPIPFYDGRSSPRAG